MTLGFRTLLPLACAFYVVLVLAVRALIHYRHTGKTPIVFPRGDSAHSYIGRLFELLLLAIAVDVGCYLVGPGAYRWLMPVPVPVSVEDTSRIAGVVLLLASAVFIFVAQVEMGVSWRIGIDEANATALVERGLYRRSRNPIYLGMGVSLVALLLLLPNALTLVIVAVAFAIVPDQVRLEEEFLAKRHGPAFDEFKKRVPRWF